MIGVRCLSFGLRRLNWSTLSTLVLPLFSKGKLWFMTDKNIISSGNIMPLSLFSVCLTHGSLAYAVGSWRTTMLNLEECQSVCHQFGSRLPVGFPSKQWAGGQILLALNVTGIKMFTERPYLNITVEYRGRFWLLLWCKLHGGAERIWQSKNGVGLLEKCVENY